MNFFDVAKKAASPLVDFGDNSPSPTPITATAKPLTNIDSSPSFKPIDNDVLEELKKVIRRRSSNYTTLLDTASKMEKAIPDENARLKAAFAVMSSNISLINQAIDVHIQDLEGERLRFQATHDQKLKEKSGTLREQSDRLKQDSANKTEQINQIQQQIKTLQDTIFENNRKSQELDLQAAQAERDIQNVAANFESAVEFLKGDLKNKKISLSNTLS
jgi:methyl-accepting chemotaxis protein